jgi:hypothetical protein
MPAVVSGRSQGRVSTYARAPESSVLAQSMVNVRASRTTGRLEGCQGFHERPAVAEVILDPIDNLGARSLFRLTQEPRGHYAVSEHVRAADSADAADARIS